MPSARPGQSPANAPRGQTSSTTATAAAAARLIERPNCMSRGPTLHDRSHHVAQLRLCIFKSIPEHAVPPQTCCKVETETASLAALIDVEGQTLARRGSHRGKRPHRESDTIPAW